MTDNVTQLPDLSVVLDLDTAERDPKEVKPPFTVKVQGRKVTFKDPGEIDWRDLLLVSSPYDMLNFSLERDDKKFVMDLALPSWKFARLMEDYYEHYDLEERISEARRRAQFEKS